MEFLKNVLIKEVDGTSTGDKVVYVDNLPKSLLYRKEKKLIIDYTTPQQRMVPDFVLNEKGQKVPTGALEDTLLPGIEMSQTSDGAFCFFTMYNEAKQRLAEIDRYIRQTAPAADRIPQRIPYAMQPGVMSSGPRPLSDIPRVVLPEPVSPPANAVQDSGAPSSDSPKKRRPMTEEHKKKVRAALALARERKKSAQAK